MSIVDNSQQGKGRSWRGRSTQAYNPRRGSDPMAKWYEAMYVVAVTGAFTLILLSTFGMLLFANKFGESPAKDECYDSATMEKVQEAIELSAQVLEEHAVATEEEESSPLQHILRRDNMWDRSLSDDDELLEQRVRKMATMEESSLVIGETVVPEHERDQLCDYVQNHIDASKMISQKEAEAILAMIHLNTTDMIFLHGHSGILGTLRNSLTLALCTHKQGNVHFMMVTMQLEAHLGWWTFLSSSERTAWNLAMKSALERKMKHETGRLLDLELEPPRQDAAMQPRGEEEEEEEGNVEHLS